MRTNRDHYEVLGLPRGASADEIRRAHRKLVREHHPDANPQDPRAEERFKEVQHAYEVLSDEAKRRKYDAWLRAPSPSTSDGKAGRPRARETARGRSASGTDLSELLRKLKSIFGNARSGRASDTGTAASGGNRSGASNDAREKRVRGPKARKEGKRVKGPKARRRSRGD